MAEKSPNSPWAHHKARSWLGAIVDQSGLIHSVDDLLNMPDPSNHAQFRAIATLLILLGRRGIWPVDPAPTLEKSFQRLHASAPLVRTKPDRPLTLKEHSAMSKSADSIKEEIEILKRRCGKSLSIRAVSTPSGWKPFWSGDSTSAPWYLPAVNQWLSNFQPWLNYTHQISLLLRRKPQQFPNEIRAAAALVIILGRDKLWPTADLEEVIYLASTKLNHVRNMTFSLSKKRPDLLNDKRFKALVSSIDQECKILNSRMSRVHIEVPEEPPATWHGFWI